MRPPLGPLLPDIYGKIKRQQLDSETAKMNIAYMIDLFAVPTTITCAIGVLRRLSCTHASVQINMEIEKDCYGR